MATFVVLTDPVDGSHLVVNLDQIRFVRSSPEKLSTIHFDCDHSISVKESGENIARLSAKANWA